MNHVFSKLILFAVTCSGAWNARCQDFTQNFVEKITAIESASSTIWKGVRSVTYFDGLGKEVSTLVGGVGQRSVPVATFTGYDNRGDITESWLPIKLPNWNLTAPADVLDSYQDFYDDDNCKDEFSYDFRPSPRLQLRRRPGEAQAAGPGKRREYHISETKGVLSFKSFSLDAAGALRFDGGDDSRKMRVIKEMDEDDRTVYRFYDMADSIVMERKVDSQGNEADTHWVRDQLRRVRYIVSPKGSLRIYSEIGAAGGNVSQSIIDTYCHAYDYDNFGRLIRMKQPQAGAVEMAYDSHWRPVLTQDANMRANGQVMTTAFDKFNRPTVTTVLSTTRDGDTLRDSVSNFYSDSQFTGNGPYMGYTAPWGNRASIHSALTINFYDNYDWLSALPDSLASALQFESDAAYDGKRPSAKTRVTGGANRVLEENSSLVQTSKWVYDAVYYDDRGHESQRRSVDHLGGLTVVKWRRTVNGLPLAQSVRRSPDLNIDNPKATTTVASWTYDDVGRETSCSMTVNNEQSPLPISSKTFDSIGRIVSDTRSSILSETFRYDIQSRMTSHDMQSATANENGVKAFNEHVVYEEPYLDTTKSLSGNPSSRSVSTFDDSSAMATRRLVETFEYDDFNRLSSSDRWEKEFLPIVQQSTIDKKTYYSTEYRYDLNSSPTHITRKSADTIIDDLTITVDGNRPVKIYDESDFPSSSSEAFFEDNADKSVEYTYDANGNLTSDLNRRIESVSYNHMNLPKRITFMTGDIIDYLYDATGRLLGERVYVDQFKRALSGLSQSQKTFEELPDLTIDYAPEPRKPTQRLFLQSQRDFVGDITFQSKERILDRVEIPGGFILADSVGNLRPAGVYRVFTDYRGSVMAVANDSLGIVESRYYYPYGIPHELPDVDKHAFEGKKMELTARLHWLDYGPRRYDPATTFWTSPDPLSSLRPDVSPYAYCAANPVANIDPTGERIVYAYDGNEYVCVEDGTGNYYFNHDSLGRLDEKYCNILTDAINEIGSGPLSKFFLDQIIDDEETVFVKKNKYNYYGPKSKTINWNFGEENPSEVPKALLEIRSLPASLFHEMSHAYDDIKGVTNNTVWFTSKDDVIKKNELVACQRENIFRAEHALPLRRYYAYGEDGGPATQSRVTFHLNVFQPIITHYKFKLCKTFSPFFKLF